MTIHDDTNSTRQERQIQSQLPERAIVNAAGLGIGMHEDGRVLIVVVCQDGMTRAVAVPDRKEIATALRNMANDIERMVAEYERTQN